MREPWNGEAEPVFMALEAAIEAGQMTPCYVSVEMRWPDEDTTWEEHRDDASILGDARARLKYAPSPPCMSVQVWYPTLGPTPDVQIIILAEADRFSMSAQGTSAHQARRAYDAANTVLVERALAREVPFPIAGNLAVSEPLPQPRLAELQPAAESQPEDAKAEPPPGQERFKWLESRPVLGTILVAFIAAVAVIVAKVV